MTRWLPFPRMSAVLLGLWLILNQSLAAGHWLLGAALAIGIPLGAAALQSTDPGPSRPAAAFRLFRLVIVDIARSNVAVAGVILHPRQRKTTAAFMTIPLALHNPNGLALLACIVTSTPGTLWVDYDADRESLLLHVLDLVDEDDWLKLIKGRYEPLLLEIFE